MCTAITLKTDGFYFGRTLDYERSYGESVVITPRRYPLNFGCGERVLNHYAIIGTALLTDRFPLYYDAMNEKGLCMAGLNFVGNACYGKDIAGKINVAQFEFIPYILSHCQSVEEAEELLKAICVTDRAFSPDMPVAELHWLIADRHNCITVECVKEGMKIYKNEVGVLTNNPPFDMQVFNLNNYMALSCEQPSSNFAQKLNLKAYSRGMGGMGLPGDLSSQSRFVRASFFKANSPDYGGEGESVNEFFHLLSSVAQPMGSCKVGEGYEITLYSCCYSAESGTYYYTTYENRAISAVRFSGVDLEGDKLLSYPHKKEQFINYQN